MGLFRKVHQFHRHMLRMFSRRGPESAAAGATRERICRFEHVESRQLLSISPAPAQIGVVYYEDASGEDQGDGDTFEITFSGGQPNTQLAGLVIDTDKDGLGLSLGDCLFDTVQGGVGAYAAAPLKIVGKDGIDDVTWQVSDGGTRLEFTFHGFDAGERLLFKVDVDEMGFKTPNAVAEGNEFEGSILKGTFTAPHFENASGQAVFADDYNKDLTDSGLNLPNDDYVPPGSTPMPVRTAAAFFNVQQKPLPITLSGTVFEDINLDNVRQDGDLGIPNVTLTLLSLDNGRYTATGKTTLTDNNGSYHFEGLLPGTYRVEETQPNGLYSVGSRAGTVGGLTRGQIDGVDAIMGVALLGGEDSLHNDFAEARPATLQGYVYHDADNDGHRDSGESGIPGALVRIYYQPGDGTSPAPIEVRTGNDGAWSAGNLRPGDYRVEEVQPDGYLDGLDAAGDLGGTAHNPGDLIDGIHLQSNQIGREYDFGEIRPSSISGRVAADFNDNRTIDSSDRVLPGVTLRLLDANGKEVATTQTNSQGDYSFTGLMPGTYRVEEIQPQGYFDGPDFVGTAGGKLSGNDMIVGITLVSGTQGLRYDFLELIPASLSGRVSADANDNRLYDVGEPLLAGVTLRLLDDAGNEVATTTTNNQGEYSFTGLAPGVYRVVELQPVDYFDGPDFVGSAGGTLSGTDSIVGITLGSNTQAVRYDFVELMPATISGRVSADANDNGLYDSGEPLLSGVTLRLFDSTGKQVATTQTDGEGNYKFTGLAPGQYRVTETQPDGYFDGPDYVGSAGGSLDGNDNISGITLGSNTQAVRYDFVEEIPASISGRVSADTNNNGHYDVGEPLLGGVTLRLLDSSGKEVARTQTNSSGEYTFAGLAPGVYAIEEIQPENYYDGPDYAGSAGGTLLPPDSITDIRLGSGAKAVRYDFVELIPVSIHGRVAVDDNANNLFDSGETPLGDVTVELLSSTGAVLSTTRTNAQGEYAFEGLAPGTYGVHEVQPAGYFDGADLVGSAGGTLVAPDSITAIALTSGMSGQKYDFLELAPSAIRGRVVVDVNANGKFDSDDKLLGSVAVRLLDSTGKQIAVTQTNASGEYSFENLTPGVYGVEEVQPAGYFDSTDFVGSASGSLLPPDSITDIKLVSGTTAVRYDFFELLPVSLSGYVYVDDNNDGARNTGESPIAGVTLTLLDAQGQATSTQTTTDGNGYYHFDGLAPGNTYGVAETQPTGYLDGQDSAGTAGGTAKNPGDAITGAVLGPNVQGQNYNFGELRPASLSGRVYLEKSEDPLPGVTIRLKDSTGKVVATTTTGSDGRYRFDNILPGTYCVEETQPAGYYLDGPEHPGTAGGTLKSNDMICEIPLASGTQAEEYNFVERLPATLSGYVFQDGPTIELQPGDPVPDPATVRTGVRKPGDIPLAGVVVRLGDGSGVAILDAGNKPITAVTDADGYYEFTNLIPGIYTVLENQPDGYIDGIDTPGSNGGTAINRSDPKDPRTYGGLASDPHNDAITKIPLGGGDRAVSYNFSEVKIDRVSHGYVPPELTPPLTPRAASAMEGGGVGGGGAPAMGAPRPLVLGGGVSTWYDPPPFTWHLSVINAGQPRRDQPQDLSQMASISPASMLPAWKAADLSHAEWMLADGQGRKIKEFIFGVENGIPVTGDFNGDGVTDIGVFVDGMWFIDLNGNGVWDEGDLFVRLGNKGDRPVTGDWDGDGKTDLGIFGPAWLGDGRAISTEPGLPDKENLATTERAKNVPPTPDQATLGWRTMKRTSRGTERSDLIDHVFQYGTTDDVPIAGDWNGDGVANVGLFRNGTWYLDTDGNGRWSAGDQYVEGFGQKGDIPVVGDFNGDGVDDIGVYRGGSWIVDANNNHKIDAKDKVFELGGAGDKPVVGDFNGDGIDEVAVYRGGVTPPGTQASAPGDSATPVPAVAAQPDAAPSVK